MNTTNFSVIAAAAGLLLWGCQNAPDKHAVEHPAEVVAVEGSDLSRVTLSEKAMQRLDLKLDQVRGAAMSGNATQRTVVPYSSLIYDPQGRTWVYVSSPPRTFTRHKVDVDRIEGDEAFLNDGPPVGTAVASVGVAELYGAEFKVGH